jgi:tetratricopeptide (TPR) repeat protein
MIDRGGAQGLQFFVSYTAVDRPWAEWIAWQLEAAGHRVIVQAWDFRPGENFIDRMRRALDTSDRTLAVVSAAYLESVYGGDEWMAAFIHHRPGETSLLVVRVEAVLLPRLLRPWVYIDLVGLDPDAAARQLLDGVRPGRRKPEEPPAFPPAMASASRTGEPSFPGQHPAIRNLPPRNLTFTGRETLLAELRANLVANASVAVVTHALYGLGGVGKTQLALEYAYRHGADYDLIWWIPAESTLTISSAIVELAPNLGLDAQVDQERLVTVVLDALRDRDRWLLVFDNAEQPEDIARFQPAGGGGHLLVTSRNPAWGSLGKRVRVDVLPRDEAVSVLLRPPADQDQRTADQDRISADQLADELGDLPLALEQAAAYLERTGMPLKAYLALYRRQRQALLAKGRAVAYQGQVDTTWRLTIDHLGRDLPAGVELLQLCAFLAPEAIPLELVTARPERLPGALAAAAADGEAGIHEAAGACYQYSLIDRDVAGIRVHRLVQQVISADLTKEARQATISLAIDLLDAALPLGSEANDPQLWPRFAQLIPHVLVATLHAQSTGVAEATSAILLQRAAAYLWWVRGEYTAARDVLNRALPLGRAALEPTHPSMSWILNDLGAIHRELGNLVEARTYLEEALATRRAAATPDPRHEATTLDYLGQTLHDLGDLAGARAALSEGLAIKQRSVESDHPEVGSVIGHLGEVLRGLGEAANARAMQEQALAIKKAALGSGHPSVGRTFRNLGKALYDLGDLAGARTAFEQAQEILEAALGPDHPHVGSTYWGLGLVLHAQGDLTGARTQIDGAHRIFQASYGPEHPTTQAVTCWIADIQHHSV